MSTSSGLAHTRTGPATGEPLVLLHGIGMSRGAWDPLLPFLNERFDVVALDLPGFGESAPLPDAIEPHPAALAASVAATLDSLGIASPHLVGNSLGGWVALELASITTVSSVTLLSPAGLWRDRTPRYCHVTLASLRLLARFCGPLVRPLCRSSVVRWAIFRPILARPRRMDAALARRAISDLGRAPGFRTVLRASLHRAYVARGPILAPVSISFGTKDLVLPRNRARRVEALPAQTRVDHLRGTGHVPMTDDPEAVASLIRRTAHRADEPATRRTPARS